MTFEDLVDFAVSRGGSISFKAEPDLPNRAVRLAIEARLTGRWGLGRNDVRRAEVLVSEREIRCSEFSCVKHALRQLVAAHAEEASKLSEEERLHDAMTHCVTSEPDPA